MRELFVYYRVPSAAVPLAREQVQHFQTELRTGHPGLIARLLHRPADDHGTQTWMETYAIATADGVTPSIEAEIAARAAVLAPLIDGPRHVEVFHADRNDRPSPPDRR